MNSSEDIELQDRLESFVQKKDELVRTLSNLRVKQCAQFFSSHRSTMPKGKSVFVCLADDEFSENFERYVATVEEGKADFKDGKTDTQ